MSSPRQHAAPRRVADLRLRGPHGTLEAHVTWPAGVATPGLVVFLPDAPGEPDAALTAEFVVLAPRCGDADPAGEAAEALEWAAAHAVELGADPARLLVAGGGALAAEVVRRARERGWPEVAR